MDPYGYDSYVYDVNYTRSPYIDHPVMGPTTLPTHHMPSNRLYSAALTDLCDRTENSLHWLKYKLSKKDPCYEYDVKYWHWDENTGVFENNRHRHGTYKGVPPAWEENKVLFTEDADFADPRRRHKADPPGPAPNKFCYLCSTLEEHQQHLARRGPQLKPKKRRKPRVEYIAPPPTVKPKKPEPEPEKEEVLYRVNVTTGDAPNAGTSANVFMRLHGTKGSLRKRQLKKNFGSLNFHFGKGTTQSFYIKGPDVGHMQWLTIQHDGKHEKDSWFLEEIEVTNMRDDVTSVFLCRRWLSLFFGDHRTKYDLEAAEREQEISEFEVLIFTGKRMMAGTDANVYITFYGGKGVSKKIKLVDGQNKDPFESGQTDQFHVDIPSVGPLTKIRFHSHFHKTSDQGRSRVEHDNTGSAPGWYVDKVVIRDLKKGKEYVFPCNQWFATDEGDGRVSRDLMPVKGVTRAKVKKLGQAAAADDSHLIDYEVTVVTGMKMGAGTDARVYIHMFGSGGYRTSEIELVDKSKDTFERGETDIFRVKGEDVGKIKKLVIRHDNTSLAAGWYLDSITLKRFYSKTQIQEILQRADDELGEKVREKVEEMGGMIEHDSPRLKYKSSVKKKGKEHRKSKADSSTSESSDEDDDYDQHKKRSSRRHRRHDESDSSDSEDHKHKRKHGKKKKTFTYKDYTAEVTESDDSEEEDDRRRSKTDKRKDKKKDKKRRDKRRDSEPSEEESEDDTYIKGKRSHTSGSRSRRGRGEKVPFYEEYVFVCKRWLATDEDDGQITREFTPKKMTVIYKV